jgi:tripartite-type tricarboxylate transporter receptor subunit TctC
MKRSLYITVLFLIGLGWISIPTSNVRAQSYPNRTIQLITPGAPGLLQDITCRQFAEEIGKTIGGQVIVVNKTGASMTLAADAVVRSKKDGYTFLYASATPLVYAPVTNPKIVPYDPLKDLEPLGGQLVWPLTVTVQEGSPWKTFHELIDYAKKNPEKLRMGSIGLGSTDNFNLTIIQSLTGTQFTHIPMSTAPALSLLGGHIEVVMSPITEVNSYVQAGKLRLLLLTSKLPRYPNIPTITELGYKQELITGWLSFFAPTGIPEDVKKVWVAAIEKAFNNPELKAKIEKVDFSPVYKFPAEFKKMLEAEYQRANELADKIGLRK